MTVTIDGVVYTTTTVWLAWAFASLGVCVASALALVALSRSWPPRRGGGRVAALVSSLVFFGLVCVYDGTLVLAALLGGGLGFQLSPWRVFAPVMRQEVAVALGAALLAVLVSALVAGRQARQGRRALGVIAAVAGLLGFAGAHVGMWHVHGLLSVGPLPTFAEHSIEWFHVGQSLELTPRLAHRPRAWTVGALPPLSADEPGEISFEEHATSRWATASRRTAILARAEAGDLAFPLRVGSRWEYSRAEQRTDVLLLIPFESRHAPEEAALTVEVVKTRVVNGVRHFEVRSVEKRGRARSRWLYAVGGDTYVLAKRGDVERLQLDGEYRFPPLPGLCRGVALPTGEVRLPGPCECTATPLDAGTVIAAVVTAGLFAPGIRRHTYRLERSTPGPADADHALADEPVPEPAALPEPSCPAENPPELCISSRVISSDARRALRFAEVLREKGLDVMIDDEDFVVRGAPDAIERHLGLEVEWRRGHGLCPGESVCRAFKRWKPAPSKLYRRGLHYPRVGAGPCAKAAP